MKIYKIVFISLLVVPLLSLANFFAPVKAQVTINSSCQDPNYAKGLNTVYRQWNPGLIDHFYTLNPDETGVGYVREQSTWGAVNTQKDNTIPLYRYYSPSDTDHFYSTSSITPQNYMGEGLLGFVFLETVPGAVPLYRLYRHIPGNPANGDHMYTTSAAERDSATANGYQMEVIEAYVCPMPAPSAM
jgi:hypothetical protein